MRRIGRNLRSAALLVLLSASVCLAFNLSYLWEYAPGPDQARIVHMLDSEPFGNDYIISCGVGGLWIFEAGTNPPELVSYYRGQGQIYNFHATGDVAFIAYRSLGGKILDLSNPAEPSLFHNYREDGVSVEDGVLIGEYWWLAAHDQGLKTLNQVNPNQISQFLNNDLSDAWAVEPYSEDLIFVADGEGGVAVVEISDEPSAELVATLETSGAAIDVKWDGDLMAVAVGDAGIDIFSISDPSDPEFLHNVNTPNISNHVSVSDGKVAVADWEQILLIDATTGDVVGSKYTPGRAMGIFLSGNDIYVADWREFRKYQYGIIEDGDIEVEPRYMDLSFVPSGESVDTILVVQNVGLSTLNLTDITSTSPAFEVDITEAQLEPEEEIEITVTYTHNRNLTGNTTLTFESNDPDEAAVEARLIGHGGAVGLGDPAPDLTMPLLDDGIFDLEEHRGEVILIVFWASW